MMHDNARIRTLSSRQSGWRLVAGAVTAAMLLAGAAGCDRSDPLSDAVKTSRNKLVSLNTGNIGSPSAERRSKVYGEVISELQQGLKGAGDTESKAAANLLLAQAQAGRADIQQSGVESLEAQLLRQLNDARAILLAYRDKIAEAAALSVYDPRPDLELVDRKMEETSEELSRARAAAAQTQAEIDDLKERGGEISRLADEQRRMENELRNQALEARGETRMQLITRANEHQRQADALEVSEAELLAQAARLQPIGDEIQLRISRILEQRELLTEARARANQHKQEMEAKAEAAREEARRIGRSLTEAVQAARQFHDEQLRPAYDEVTGDYRTALSTVRSAASKADRASSGLVEGTIQQAFAGLQLAYAQTMVNVRGILDSIESTEPVPGDGSVYRSFAEAAETAHEEAMAGAAESYDAAGSAFGRAGGRGESGESLQRTSERLAAMASEIRGDPPTPAPDESPTDEQMMDDASSPEDDGAMDDGSVDGE